MTVATDRQLKLLASYKVWYVDTFFQYCQVPIHPDFPLILSLKYGNAKLTPLLFVLMSCKRNCDKKSCSGK